MGQVKPKPGTCTCKCINYKRIPVDLPGKENKGKGRLAGCKDKVIHCGRPDQGCGFKPGDTW